MKTCFLIIVSLMIALSQVEPALSYEVLELADWLLESGSYDEAVTEYKRFIFFNSESDRVGYAYYRMGLAYRASGDWQKAIDALRESISAAKDLQTADERRIVLATTLIASGNYSLARLELLKVSDFSEDQSLRLKSMYFDGIASLYMLDWDASQETLGKFYSEYDEGRMSRRAKEINTIILKTRNSYRSGELAKSLSTLLPGLGQVYAGDWRDSLNALVLNGLLIGLTANSIYKRDYSDAALISYISLRYYIGNRYQAEMDARKYNESLDRRSAGKILKLIRTDEPT